VETEHMVDENDVIRPWISFRAGQIGVDTYIVQKCRLRQYLPCTFIYSIRFIIIAFHISSPAPVVSN